MNFIFSIILKFLKIIEKGFFSQYYLFWGFSGGTAVKNQPINSGDTGDEGSIPVSGRSSGVGNGNPFQYSCLENFTGRRARWATVHGVAKSRVQLSACTHTHTHTHTHLRFCQLTLLDPSIQFSRSVVSDSLRPHESQHARPPCSSQTPKVYSNSCPLSW